MVLRRRTRIFLKGMMGTLKACVTGQWPLPTRLVGANGRSAFCEKAIGNCSGTVFTTKRTSLAVVGHYVPLLIGVLLLLPSVDWLARDHRVWPWDQAYYAMLTLKIQHAMRRGWLLGYGPSSKFPMNVRRCCMAGADRGAARGGVQAGSTLVLINILGGGATLWLYSRPCVAWRRHGAATAAIILWAVLRASISLTHQFLVEGVQVMTIAALIWVAARTSSLVAPVSAGIVGSAAIAMLAKTTSIAFIFPLIAYIMIARRLTRHEPRPSIRSIDYCLALGALTLFAICAGWYTLHRAAIMAHVREAMDGDVALFYGSIRLFSTSYGSGSAKLCSPFPLPLLAGITFAVSVLLPRNGWVSCCVARSKNGLTAVVDTGLLFALCLAGDRPGPHCVLKQLRRIRVLAPMILSYLCFFDGASPCWVKRGSPSRDGRAGYQCSRHACRHAWRAVDPRKFSLMFRRRQTTRGNRADVTHGTRELHEIPRAPLLSSGQNWQTSIPCRLALCGENAWRSRV